jgi:hypothetical protein
MSFQAAATIGSAVVGGLMNRSANKAAKNANNAAADSARLQTEIARDQWDRYKSIYEPLERSYVNEAQQYDSPENYARAAGDASATVANQFSKAREQLMRTPGLDPSSGAYQAGMTSLGLSEAATNAVQQNAARMKVKDAAFARKTDALSLGKNMPAQATSGLASAAGTQAGLGAGLQKQANTEAAATGQVLGSIFTPDNMKKVGGWLGGMGGGSGGGSGSTPMAGTPDLSMLG